MEQQLIFFLALAVGLIFGGLAVWLMLRADANSAYARARAEMVAEQTGLIEQVKGKDVRIQDLTKERDQLRTGLERVREDNGDLKATNTELETRLDETEKATEAKIALFGKSQEKLTSAFKALSAEALQNNNQAFLDLARETMGRFQDGAQGELEGRQKAIDELVKPLREALSKVDVNIHEMEKTRAAAYAGISEQVQSLAATQDLLRSETSNLVSALRVPSARGRWGEMQLRRVVEMAGMASHCDFTEQTAVETDGQRLRPDMVVRLPNQRDVVVDAKVSLKAYLEALETTDEESRAAKLREHAAQVRAHLQKLGSKAYWDQFQSAPEFVVAFLPGEVFFSAALEQDPKLIEFGVDHNVILATPTTLIALLKSVAYGWRQESLAQNTKEISNLGRNLYNRLRKFTGHLEDIRRNLQRTVESYNKAVGSLESRVLVSARRFQDLGAAAGGEIPSLEPVDSFPRSLQAVDRAVSGEGDEGEEPPRIPEPAEIAELPAEADEAVGFPESELVEADESVPEPELVEAVEAAGPANESAPSEVADTTEFPTDAGQTGLVEDTAEEQNPEDEDTKISYGSFVKTV